MKQSTSANPIVKYEQTDVFLAEALDRAYDILFEEALRDDQKVAHTLPAAVTKY